MTTALEYRDKAMTAFLTRLDTFKYNSKSSTSSGEVEFISEMMKIRVTATKITLTFNAYVKCYPDECSDEVTFLAWNSTTPDSVRVLSEMGIRKDLSSRSLNISPSYIHLPLITDEETYFLRSTVTDMAFSYQVGLDFFNNIVERRKEHTIDLCSVEKGSGGYIICPRMKF